MPQLLDCITLESAQKIAIEIALIRNNCNRTQTALALGCSVRALRIYMKKHNLRERYPAAPSGTFTRRELK